MARPATIILSLVLFTGAPSQAVAADSGSAAEAPLVDAPHVEAPVEQPPAEQAAVEEAQGGHRERVSARQARMASLAAERQAMRERRQHQMLLAVVGLLVLLLVRRLLQVPEPPAAKASHGTAAAPRLDHRPPHRRVALNHEELGHFVVELARSQDLHGFRELFLSGPEAARHFGLEQGQVYLERRSDDVLGAALLRLSQEVGLDCIYRGAADLGEGLLGVRLRSQDGAERVVPVGRVVDIEGGSRLVMPG